MASRLLIDRLHERLREEGWTDVRGPYGFVLLAVRDDGLSARGISELLGVSKQATSQLLDAMERDGYIRRAALAADARAKRVVITARGKRLLKTVEGLYAELEGEWSAHVGHSSLQAVRSGLEDVLASVFGAALPPVRPTW